jgi:hypothetical protein
VLPLGLPATSLPALIGDLAANNQTALGSVPGITPQIIGAGVGGLREAYNQGFRFVWVAAGCFMLLAAICMLNLNPHAETNALLFKIFGSSTDSSTTGAFFLVDPVKEFNMHIDHPAEKEEELFA